MSTDASVMLSSAAVIVGNVAPGTTLTEFAILTVVSTCCRVARPYMVTANATG